MTHGADLVTEQSPWLASMMPLGQQDVLSKPASPLKAHPNPPVKPSHIIHQSSSIVLVLNSGVAGLRSRDWAEAVDRAKLAREQGKLRGAVDAPHWLHSTGQQTSTPAELAPSIPGTPLLHHEYDSEERCQMPVRRNAGLRRHEPAAHDVRQ